MCCTPGSTVSVCTCCAAGAQRPSPAWSALTRQVPTATSVTCAPSTVQTSGVCEAWVTGSSDDAAALSCTGRASRVVSGSAGNTMVWARRSTSKLRCTSSAAVHDPSPACAAATVQVPGATRSSAVPLTVHTSAGPAV